MKPPAGRSAREHDAHAGVHYPGTETLVNLLDIRDAKELSRQEHVFTRRRMAEGLPREQIAPWMERQMAALKEADYLRGLDQATFCEKAAILVNEINAAHPFIEGNGRVQRIWLRLVADQAGYRLTFSERDGTPWYEASRIGFERADHVPMQRLLQMNITNIPSLTRPAPGHAPAKPRPIDRGRDRNDGGGR